VFELRSLGEQPPQVLPMGHHDLGFSHFTYSKAVELLLGGLRCVIHRRRIVSLMMEDILFQSILAWVIDCYQ
jgi:hypothetical protein